MLNRYAEIQNEIIFNVFVADEDFVAHNKPDAIICPDWVGVGDQYKDGEFSRVTITGEDELEA